MINIIFLFLKYFQIVTCSDDACHRIWKVGLENAYDEQRHDLHGQAELVHAAEMQKMQRTPTTRKRRISNREVTPSSANRRGKLNSL